MGKILMLILVIMTACGAVPKMVSSGDEDMAKKYSKAMSAGSYSYAFGIAKKGKLGKKAIRKAGYADMWVDLKDGSIVTAHSRANDMELSDAERKIFGEASFPYLISTKQCGEAAELAWFFGLDKSYLDKAVVCMEKKSDFSHAMALVCLRGASHRKKTSMYSRLGDLLDSRSGTWYKNIEQIVMYCKLEGAFFSKAFERLLKINDLELVLVLVRQADQSIGKASNPLKKRLFGKALKKKKFSICTKMIKEGLIAGDVNRATTALVNGMVDKFECSKAVIFAREQKLPRAVIEKVFSSKKCFSVDYSDFLWRIQYAAREEWVFYFGLATKHKNFAMAWDLARYLERGISRVGRVKIDYKKITLASAYADNAYMTVIRFAGIDKESVLEYTLTHKEEWFAATNAKEHSKNPEAIVERSFLKAMERGKYVMAIQLTERYGDPKFLKARGRLAFEMAMLAKKPVNAQYIYKMSKLNDSKLYGRAAIMLYRQKRKTEREKRRKQKRRKKRRQGDDWTVKRE